jgi:hypothetical protein
MNHTMRLLLGMLLISSSIAQADTTYGHSFLATRPLLCNLPMEMSAWQDFNEKITENSIGSYLQVVPFAQRSVNRTALGKYFGVFNTNNGRLDNYIGVGDIDYPEYQLNPRDILHSNSGSPAPTLRDKVRMRPAQTTIGTRLDYYQILPIMNNNWYIRASTALARVKTMLHPKAIDPRNSSSALPNDSNALSGESFSLLEYLRGDVVNTSSKNAQEALAYARWGNPNAIIGLADIKASLGYALWSKESTGANHHHIDISAQMIIPTGNRPKAVNLFEPTVGNRGHLGLGARIDALYSLGQINSDLALDLLMVVDYHYLLSSKEMRTLMFKNTDGSISPWQLYKQGGIKGQAKVMPMANILTQKVRVTPNHNVEALVQLSIESSRASLDIGYNLFARGEEQIAFNGWLNDTYALANIDYDTSYAFEPSDADHSETGNAIQSTDLLLNNAATPSVFNHTLFVSASYQGLWDNTPWMIALGGSFEMSGQTNNALEQLAIWGKFAVHF